MLIIQHFSSTRNLYSSQSDDFLRIPQQDAAAFSSFFSMQIIKANTVTFTMNYLISPDKVLCGLTQSFKRLGCGVRAAGAVQELHVPELTAMMASDLMGCWDSLMFRCLSKPQSLLPPCIRMPRGLGFIIPPGVLPMKIVNEHSSQYPQCITGSVLIQVLRGLIRSRDVMRGSQIR